MSQVSTYINTVSISIASLPSQPGPASATLSYTADPSTGNPFQPLPPGSGKLAQGVLIATEDPAGNVPPGLIGAQLVFIFTQDPNSPVQFTVTGITPNDVNDQPLYRGDQVLPMGESVAVVMTIPRALNPRATSFDYTINILSDKKSYTIDPDIPVEVQN